MKQKIVVHTIVSSYNVAEVDLPEEAFLDIHTWMQTHPEEMAQATLELVKHLGETSLNIYMTKEDVDAVKFVEPWEKTYDFSERANEELEYMISTLFKELPEDTSPDVREMIELWRERMFVDPKTEDDEEYYRWFAKLSDAVAFHAQCWKFPEIELAELGEVIVPLAKKPVVEEGQG
jgi:hypothetical protein